jgi:hypothetical protein
MGSIKTSDKEDSTGETALHIVVMEKKGGI